MKSLLLLSVAVLVCQSANADCASSSGDYRKCFDNTNAPPALVYKLFVNDIFSESLQDEEHRRSWHYVKAGLTPNMSSADVVRYFVPKYLEIELKVEETQKRMLCLDRKPRFEGAENFAILNDFDEVALAIYQTHLIIAKSDLSASGLFDLDKALAEYPASFTMIFTDHEKTRNGSEQRAYNTAIALCEKPYERVFQSSRPTSEE